MTAPIKWMRFAGEPARFSVRTWRDKTLADVRVELQAALGLHFASDDTDPDDPAFTCATPACELRLNSWPSEANNWRVYNFVGTPFAPEDEIPPNGEVISDALAAFLRDAGADWYVPSKNEFLDEAGVLGDSVLEPDVIVSILAPMWLSSLSAEERYAGTELLVNIARTWVSSAQRASDPGAEVKRRKAELQRRFAEPSARLRILASYAVQDQLSS